MGFQLRKMVVGFDIRVYNSCGRFEFKEMVIVDVHFRGILVHFFMCDIGEV